MSAEFLYNFLSTLQFCRRHRGGRTQVSFICSRNSVTRFAPSLDFLRFLQKETRMIFLAGINAYVPMHLSRTAHGSESPSKEIFISEYKKPRLAGVRRAFRDSPISDVPEEINRDINACLRFIVPRSSGAI